VIVDSSVLVAMARGERESSALTELLDAARQASISSATLLETSLVLRDAAGQRFVDRIAERLNVVPFDSRQLAVARAAHQRFGRGSGHPARLNLGDCFSYALAVTTGEPLLFKGDDFTHTDVTPAYVPD
jgi:ribonuclease VapC